MSIPHVITNVKELVDEHGTALATQFIISKPRDNAGGKGKSALVGFGTSEKVVYFQTPRVYVPFGTDTFKSDTGYEKLTLLTTLMHVNKGCDEFVTLVKALDEAVVTAAFENQDAWFGHKEPKTIDIIRDRHHPLLQERDGYDPQLKLKICDESTRTPTRIYDKTNEMSRVEGTHVSEKVTGKAMIAFGPVWCVNGKFGVQARCEQFLIVNQGSMGAKRGLDKCMLEDDDEGEGDA